MSEILTKEAINAQIEKNKDSMIDALKGLIQIKSVKESEVSTPSGKLPFGRGIHEALLYMEGLARKEEFQFENIDNYGGHIDFGPKTDETMGILVHLDVVPEGSDWDYDPYGGEVVDSRLYGRGTTDDKGPAIAAFYAMKALKDLGYIPKKRVRLVLGLDEETGWSGMEYYLDKVGAPDFGFTPDAEFPAIHGEKGILVFDIVKKLSKTVGLSKGLALSSLKGGTAANMVADYARAVVKHEDVNEYALLKEKVQEYRLAKNVRMQCKLTGKSFEITAYGLSAHGARPEQGVNAISILMDFLGTLTFREDDVNDFISFFNIHIGFELDGKSLSIDFSDRESGKLVFNVGMAHMDKNEARVTVNIRYPVTMTDEEVYDALMKTLSAYDLGIIKTTLQKPIYFSVDHPMIVTLMDIYREHTGDRDTQPLVIAGGTYARAANGFVAYGPAFPGDKEVMHQKNEYVEIDRLLKAAGIYADAIYRLTKDA